MAKLTWDEAAKRLYETGVDHVVLFPMDGTKGKADSGSTVYTEYGQGKAWNGVTGITENPEGADANDIYADNMKYLSLISVENWKATIKAYTWPREFNACQGELEYNDGTHMGLFFGQQNHMKFGLAWRTIQGNAVKGDSYGYKLHVAYGLTAAPSEKDHATVNDSPEATEFSWDLNSIPDAFISTIDPRTEEVLAPTSHIVVDSVENATGYAALEAALMGTNSTAPYLPTPDTLAGLVS
jgi:hypothetical protein